MTNWIDYNRLAHILVQTEVKQVANHAVGL